MSTTTTSRNGKQARQRTFRIVFWIEGVAYTVIPLKPDPAAARKAFRFIKRDRSGKVEASYDIQLSPEGHAECECRGFLRWGYCKHIRTLRAAGMFEPEPQAAEGEACNGKEE